MSRWIVGSVWLCACGPSLLPVASDDTTSTGATGSSTSATVSTTASPTIDGEGTGGPGRDTEHDPTAAMDGASGDPVADLPGCRPLACGNNIYECVDGIDNDGDGLVDLVDPECTSTCDNAEESFGLDIPGDDVRCKRDCMFDGNSGSGDDLCEHVLQCDPENPGELLGCGYEHPAHPQCNGWPDPLVDDCITFCSPFVLPGCDCFGCCTFATPEGPLTVFLESHPDCSLDDLAACLPCTSRIDECGNVCTPEACEICIGESAPPAGCATNVCDNGNPCATTSDCACGEACLLGCCIPPPPG